MALLGGALGKMVLLFYKESGMKGLGTPYPVMYNPSSLSVSVGVKYDDTDVLTTGNMQTKNATKQARTMSFDLFFDGTGASPSIQGPLKFVPKIANALS